MIQEETSTNGQVESTNNDATFEAMKEGFNSTNQAANDAQNQETVAKAIEEYQVEQEKQEKKKAFQKKFGRKYTRRGGTTKAPKKRREYESGISENVSHGEQVLSILMSWGASYNPSNVLLKPEALDAKNIEGWAYINDVQAAKQARKGSITIRQDLFKKLGSFARRIVNELAASGAPKSVVENAQHYVDKIVGHRIIKIKASETNENHISACQTSYVQQVGHFNGLIGVVKACPQYNPNQDDLKVVALEAKSEAMANSNKSFYDTNAAYSTAMTKRNEFFNTEYTGYVETYGAVKRAAKAIYGNRSDQYKQISGYAFKKIKK